MKHPDPECQKKQEEFLKNCSEEEREFNERLFRYGNAVYIYHQLADTPKNRDYLKLYYEEWLQGLPPPMALAMREKGFEYCKTVLSFTRYVNEKQDIGLDEWLRTHLSEEDYKFYKSINANK